MLDDEEWVRETPVLPSSLSPVDTHSLGIGDMRRTVVWHPRPSLLAPAPPDGWLGYSLFKPRSAPPAPWALLLGPPSPPELPVPLGRPAPPLWHGPLPGVVGLRGPGCP